MMIMMKKKNEKINNNENDLIDLVIHNKKERKKVEDENVSLKDQVLVLKQQWNLYKVEKEKQVQNLKDENINLKDQLLVLKNQWNLYKVEQEKQENKLKEKYLKLKDELILLKQQQSLNKVEQEKQENKSVSSLSRKCRVKKAATVSICMKGQVKDEIALQNECNVKDDRDEEPDEVTSNTAGDSAVITTEKNNKRTKYVENIESDEELDDNWGDFDDEVMKKTVRETEYSSTTKNNRNNSPKKVKTMTESDEEIVDSEGDSDEEMTNTVGISEAGESEKSEKNGKNEKYSFEPLFKDSELPNLIKAIKRAFTYTDPTNDKCKLYVCKEGKSSIPKGSRSKTVKKRKKSIKTDEICDQQCNGLLRFKTHLFKYHLIEYNPLVKCSKCEKSVEYVKTYIHKTKECTGRNKKYKCQICGMDWPNKSTLGAHQKKHFWLLNADKIPGVYRLMKNKHRGTYLQYTKDRSKFNLTKIRRLYTCPLSRSGVTGEPPKRPNLVGYTKQGLEKDCKYEVDTMTRRMDRYVLAQASYSQSRGRKNGPSSSTQQNSVRTSGLNDSGSDDSPVDSQNDKKIDFCSWVPEFKNNHLPLLEQYELSRMFFNSEKAAKVGKSYMRDEIDAACSIKTDDHIVIVNNVHYPEFKEDIDGWIDDLGLKKALAKNKQDRKQWKLEQGKNNSGGM